MLTATSPSSPAAARAMRINSPCALCNAPIVGTSTRRFARGCICASAMVVRIFTGPALSNYSHRANHGTHYFFRANGAAFTFSLGQRPRDSDRMPNKR